MEVVTDKITLSVTYQFFIAGEWVEIPVDLDYLSDRIVARFGPVTMTDEDYVRSEHSLTLADDE